ncbi:MAG: prolipoprotein diacylglyceryl transferase [Phocaeicola sp.]|uniref:prolipoprotein diacylglyceryl transferase n=1 Tax=Phocaeicola TaxID=909656 RepID=UPI00234FAE0D|nr:prolipoprotein diacylglyceryl transferase [Phocaeicola oris]MCE2617648.1 prolipoprotein diacylglyceryl transferase [Phocaeicola oris]
MISLFITWNPDPVIFNIGSYPVRWYSFFWVIAIISATMVVSKIFKDKNYSKEDFSRLFVYSFLGIFIGARLGHCLFYDASYFIEHPLEAVLPIKFYPNNNWKFVGYAGLASHGGTLGLIFALFLFCRKTKIKFLKILDIIAVAAPLAAGFIRIANFMNSEIIGTETTLPWGVVFIQVDNVIRHPAQLYESIAYFFFFVIMWLLYRYHNKYKVKSGFYFGLCIFMIFTFRFFIEFLKERQVSFEADMTLDMGQILSLPFMLLGFYFLIRGGNLKNIFRMSNT